jgi:hypothetical protein
MCNMAASRSRERLWYYRLPRRLRLHLVLLRHQWPYYLRVLFWSPIELPRRLFFRFFLALLTRGWHSGIRLVCTQFGEVENRLFVQCTKDALDLIQRYDPRRFQRILREFQIIDNCALTCGGRYIRRLRRCEVDFGYYFDTTGGYLNPIHRGTDEYQRSLALYAATLIHEATHGKCYSHSIPYAEQNHLRIERLCHREEARFYSRLEQADPETFKEIGALLHPFQEEYYQQYWQQYYQQSRWEYIKQEFARLREAWRESGERERRLANEDGPDGAQNTDSTK